MFTHGLTEPFDLVAPGGSDNVWIADASVHVTNGGVNPVLTVLANALRTATGIVRG